MAQTATSYYHGIFVPPSSPSNVIKQGCIADVTGSVAPTTNASFTYTPMGGAGTDILYVNGQSMVIGYNTSATQTVTDAKASIAAPVTTTNCVGNLAFSSMVAEMFVVTGTTTLIFTARAPGTAGETIQAFVVANTGSNHGTLNRNFTGGATRWFGQGVGAGPEHGVTIGGCGALCTGVGYGTQMSPVAGRTSSYTGTTAATATWTPNTSSTATLTIAGQTLTITFNSSAAQTVTDAIAAIEANPKLARMVVPSNDGSDNLLLTADAGLDGNNIEVSTNAANGAVLVSGFSGGAGPTLTSVASAQVGAGLDAQSLTAFAANRILPSGDVTVRSGESAADVTAGTVQAVGATDAVLVTSSCTYTPPTSSIDYLWICGKPLEVLTAAGTGTANAINYETSATVTCDHIRTAIQAIPWLNDLLVVGGTTTVTFTTRTRDAYSAPGTAVAGLGPWGNAVTMKSAALNSASVNHVNLTGGATSGKGVRLALSTGTVANGAAVITNWLNEYNKTTGDNPNTGSIATGFVVTSRAA